MHISICFTALVRVKAAPLVIARRDVRRVQWLVAIACAGSFGACSGGDESAAPEAAVEAAAPADGAAGCASAGDEAAAERMGRACGNRIEVEAGRTEYTAVYVDPSGNRTMEVAVAPQRARRLDGTWGP